MYNENTNIDLPQCLEFSKMFKILTIQCRRGAQRKHAACHTQALIKDKWSSLSGGQPRLRGKTCAGTGGLDKRQVGRWRQNLEGLRICRWRSTSDRSGESAAFGQRVFIDFHVVYSGKEREQGEEVENPGPEPICVPHVLVLTPAPPRADR
jgi:hypothetical protein